MSVKSLIAQGRKEKSKHRFVIVIFAILLVIFFGEGAFKFSSNGGL